MSNENNNDEWLDVDRLTDQLELKPVTLERYAREGLLNGEQ
jgi:hypothetical protein